MTYEESHNHHHRQNQPRDKQVPENKEKKTTNKFTSFVPFFNCLTYYFTLFDLFFFTLYLSFIIQNKDIREILTKKCQKWKKKHNIYVFLITVRNYGRVTMTHCVPIFYNCAQYEENIGQNAETETKNIQNQVSSKPVKSLK